MAEEALGLKLQKFNNRIICLVHIVLGGIWKSGNDDGGDINPTHLPNPSLFHCFAENPSRVTQYRDDLVSRLLRERRRMGPDDDGAF